MLDTILNLVAPHLTELLSAAAGALTVGLIWLTKRTKTELDDQLLFKTAEEISKRKKK